MAVQINGKVKAALNISKDDPKDEKSWRKMTLVNIANAGFFSSDRTIKQYNDDIWHL
ncbi:MAG: glycogen/starch/alpha-glucan phosphorylase [Butyrivibrio sp.]|nr:glycogen/starch/alpha-glucan phosphorylase [Butyrivibrio sp.]